MPDPTLHPTEPARTGPSAAPGNDTGTDLAAGVAPEFGLAPAKIRRLGMLALVAAPLLTLAADLVQVSPTAHDTGSELDSIAAHPTSYQLAAVLGFCAMVLYVPALVTLARPLWSARPRLALVGISLSVSGAMALTSLMGSGPVSLALARAEDRAAMMRVTDAYESMPVTSMWVLLMILGFSLGPIVLAVGLWRSGYPWAVPVLLVVGLVVQMADAGRWPLAAGYALTAAGMTAAAVRMWPAAGPPAVRRRS